MLKQPKLLTKAEVTELANFVLKGGEQATEQEREIAKKTLDNPKGVEKSDIEALARRVLDRK
mgnify:CR=1 FL=1